MKKKNTDNIVTMHGSSLASTIETMEALGPVGEEVLKEFGILKIDESKRYPIEIRNAIHKAVLDKYGPIALIDMGFKFGELAHDVLIKPVVELSKKEEKNLISKNISKRLLALEKVFSYYMQIADKLINNMTESNLAKYGHEYEKVQDFQFKIKTTMSAAPYAEPFFQGITERICTEVFGKYFEYKYEFLSDLTDFGYGYSTWTWLLKFVQKKSELSVFEIVNNKEKSINKSLMKVVLQDSFLQNKKVKEISTQISKYIPPQINEQFLKGNYNTNISTRRRKLTIFFSDIKNFTKTSESLQPEDLTKYLNEYFSEMTAIALKYGATIDKYIGDAMMLFFGDPESLGEREDARACVRMALAMQKRMKILQKKWKNQGFLEPFEVRIGINTGYCNVGNFGSNQRLTYTIIGGEVNVTQRLEGKADANGILMSYETYALAQDIVEVEERANLSLKGINRIVKCFAVKDRKPTKVNKSSRLNINKKFKNKNAEKYKNSLEERIVKMEKNMKNIIQKLNKINI